MNLLNVNQVSSSVQTKR